MHNTGHKKLQLSAPVPVPCCFMEYLYRVPTLPFSISSLSPLSPYSSPRSRLCTRITTTKSPTTSDSWIRARDTDPWSPNSKQPRRISAGNGVFNIGSIKLNADGIGRGVGDERRKTTEEIGEGGGGDSSRCVLSGRVESCCPSCRHFSSAENGRSSSTQELFEANLPPSFRISRGSLKSRCEKSWNERNHFWDEFGWSGY